MKVGWNDQDIEQLHEAMHEVEFFVFDSDDPRRLRYDYYLGCSKDGAIWALYVIIRAGLENCPSAIQSKDMVCWLLDPPKREPGAIGQILGEVHLRLSAGDVVSDSEVARIIDANPFPAYPLLNSLLLNAPKSWQELPCSIEVSFELSEGGGVNRETFKHFQASDLEDALRYLSAPRVSGILLRYEVLCEGAFPLTPYEVDWPLSRSGANPAVKREKECREFPWKAETPPRLFLIRQHVARRVGYSGEPAYHDEHSIRLSVVGRTPEEAVSNWHQIARSLRAIKHRLPSDRSGPQ